MNRPEVPPETIAHPDGSVLPLVVDLDGTLLRGDTFHEVVFSALFSSPRTLVRAAQALIRGGKNRFKAALSPRFAGAAASLPARLEVLDLVSRRKSEGGRVVLATNAHLSIAQDAARRFGVFDEVLATDADDGNLDGARRRDLLVDRFGAGGYDYVGDSRTDIPAWESAATAYAVGAIAKRGIEVGGRKVQALEPTEEPPGKWKAVRPHQWVKNLLLFLPMLSAHKLFHLPTVVATLLGFGAFSCAASLVYLVNDLSDRSADRAHATKRLRPIAWGAVGPLHALVLAGILAAILVGICTALPWTASAAIAVYLAANLAYSLHFKRRLLVDVFLLAWMYAWRVVTGGLATGIHLTPWLLGFSGFAFLSLAFAKRYAEVVRQDPSRPDGSNGRAWRKEDGPALLAAGVGTGVGGALVLALYVNGESFARFYRNPNLAMLLSPLFLYWNIRLWIHAGRRMLLEDPVVFAMKDRVSYVVALAAVAILWMATV